MNMPDLPKNTPPPIQIIVQGDYPNGLSINCIFLPEQKHHMPTVLRSVAAFLELYAQRIEKGSTLRSPSLEEQLNIAVAAEQYEEAARLRNEIESKKK